MQLRRGELPTNPHRQRLAAPGFAEALHWLFFSLSCAQNCLSKSSAIDGVREKLRFHPYEKAVSNLDYRRGDSGRNGWLRADKETSPAGQGGAGRCAFR